MSSSKSKAAAPAARSEAEADPFGACVSVAVGLLIDYYADAEASGRLPADAVRLLSGLRDLPEWNQGPEAWALALADLCGEYALPSDQELASRSPELAHALRAISWALPAVGGFRKDSQGRRWVTRRPGDAPKGQDFRNLTLACIETGIALAVASELGAAVDEKDVRKRFAKLGAAAKLDRDPKQAAKREIQQSWEDWQSGRELHANQAAFARAMCARHPDIMNPSTVEGWSRTWSKERRAGTR